jgi:hypothetical protein
MIDWFAVIFHNQFVFINVGLYAICDYICHDKFLVNFTEFSLNAKKLVYRIF